MSWLPNQSVDYQSSLLVSVNEFLFVITFLLGFFVRFSLLAQWQLLFALLFQLFLLSLFMSQFYVLLYLAQLNVSSIRRVDI